MTTEKKKSCWERWNEEWLYKMKPKGPPVTKNNRELIENVKLYHDSMAMQESLLQWYRAMFVALEAALFTFAYFLDQRGYEWEEWIPGAIGIFICLSWMFVCTQRTNLIDKQRHEIKRLVQNTNLETWYEVYRGIDEAKRRRVAQNTFNWGFPALLIGMWIFLIIKFLN